MENINSLLAMAISEILIIILFLIIYFTQKKKSQLKTAFLSFLAFIFIWILGSLLQICFQKSSIDPFQFEKISGIGVHFSPVAFLALCVIFAQTKIKIKRIHFAYFIIPTISTILSLTNEHHNLMFVNYSTDMNNIIYGNFFTIHSIYSYGLYFIGMIYLLRYSIKNAGFFSKQSSLLFIGSMIPLLLNLLGTFKIIPISTYTTPIAFVFTSLFYSFAIFKFKFISSSPIALQRIVDRISDSYIILDENYNITDFNKTFLTTFSFKDDQIRGKNIFSLSNNKNNFSIDNNIFKENFEDIKNSDKTVHFEQSVNIISKTFSVEINNIFNKNSFLGILILFKDITQHKTDMKTIQENQDILIEQERLASLGQMIGGIAHNLKTPIFSVAGGLEGLSDLVKEYDASIDNESVTNEDMHDIAEDMRIWIEKLRGHISYMSDVITAVKGQTIALADNAAVDFSVAELFKRVDILMKHEIKNALATLEIQNHVGDMDILTGNINGLVQIINNIISNAIEAYGNNYTDKKIELIATRSRNSVTIAIKDYGPGISETAQKKLFKEMITTKGKNGTGLGMFMSYSNIKAHFNGNLTYETELGKGTTFFITLPIKD